MTEEMYQMVTRMIRERGINTDSVSASMAYRSVLSMLEYAHEGNLECLRQFDYYGEVK